MAARLFRVFGLPLVAASGLLLMLTGHAMAQERVLISSEWGNVTANLADNDAARALVKMLPITINMQDHLRQEKTGNLPSALPEDSHRNARALEFQPLCHLLPQRSCP